jgi:hypothetical protein
LILGTLNTWNRMRMSIHMLKDNMLMNVVNSHSKDGLIHLSEQENFDDIHEAKHKLIHLCNVCLK